jgi:hypothetical protein
VARVQQPSTLVNANGRAAGVQRMPSTYRVFLSMQLRCADVRCNIFNFGRRHDYIRDDFEK